MTLTPHPHAEMLIAIAEGKQMQQHQYLRKPEVWRDIGPSKALELLGIGEGVYVRIKPSTITINGHEFPEPMRVAPEEGAEYWLVSLINAPSPGWPECWRGDEADWHWLKIGLCQATKQGAIDCAKALLSLLEEQS